MQCPGAFAGCREQIGNCKILHVLLHCVILFALDFFLCINLGSLHLQLPQWWVIAADGSMAACS